MRLDASDLREIQLFRYYRLTRKWACKTYGLTDGDLELLIYLDCVGRFTRNDYKNGTYLMSWDKHRWEKLRKEDWIVVWRKRNHTTQKYHIYQTSNRCKRLITRIYNILLGKEDIPFKKTSVFYNNKTYTDKVFNKAIDDMIKDNER
jgi:hypothetical protein